MVFSFSKKVEYAINIAASNKLKLALCIYIVKKNSIVRVPTTPKLMFTNIFLVFLYNFFLPRIISYILTPSKG